VVYYVYSEKKEQQMNERIRKLAEQNGFIHEWMTTGEKNDKLKSLERFAEMIVRECIEISQVGSITESKLKKHFGVE
jgi:glycerol dehydrogenase-like iron-containing ADH family enzyme